MIVPTNEPCPLPADPFLREVATIVRDSGDWAWIVDRDWKLLYMTDEHRRSFNAGGEMIRVPLDEPLFGTSVVDASSEWLTGLIGPERWGPVLEKVVGLMLADVGGNADRLRAVVDPGLHTIIDAASPSEATATSFVAGGAYLDSEFKVGVKVLRIRDTAGEVRGTLFLFQPAVGMGIIGSMAFALDPDHLKRMMNVSQPSRTPAAMLFADLEGSSTLSRTLSTATYFAVARRMVRATDRCVINAGGLVGRHVGDGIVAFFPVEAFGSESEAALACITAARATQNAMGAVAAKSGLDPDEVVMRFGLHWGSTLYIGNITTAARFEVTALGDEANEAARIEACATGGRTLASKQLMERLDSEAAGQLEIDRDHLTYTKLSELPTATEKARRDAPAIAVCEL